MPVIFQKFIYRIDLVTNRNVMYLFGDNMERKGMGGQAKEMRGEPNAVGIATKKKPSMFEDSFFSDEDFDIFEDRFLADMEPVWEHLDHGGLVVIPIDGLGTGLSELPERAPTINEYIVKQLAGTKAQYG